MTYAGDKEVENVIPKGEAFVFSLSPEEEATAYLVGEVGQALQRMFVKIRPAHISGTDRRLSGYSNMRLSDLAQIALSLGCTVKVSLEPIEEDVPELERLFT